ncbi:TonB-dependent receptor domain-containing protein [Chitinophaga sp. S165]|uniref:TonB-dependent receptor family protein n=1 Tax=Chitinophaga sp. S165 TaxID=2135462 RepID=UPI000D709ED8|nr:TonB-dependent receptor [Chitinophaga sp. S165]PWV46152.1 Fe(3+) dicitrate transport protein [Chitinophaga sp. S165]
MKYSILILLSSLLSVNSYAQEQRDTARTLNEVTIYDIRRDVNIGRLDSIRGTYIFLGKKNEVIKVTATDAAVTEKYGRQIFAKIPGVFVYDMDGTGNQVNIATRGLDPHRGWESNVRKDGVITNSDMYGYPASHYNIPFEAVENIELVRGTGSLQYGAQFGGMINYVSKQPSTKPFSFESINTAGSYGLLSTFNSISGTKGKFSYYAWFNNKTNNGYRKNSDSRYNAQNITFFYRFSAKLLLKTEWTRSDYTIHLAGPLNDAMFKQDPKMATRSRNYYNPAIHVPSVSFDWQPGKNTRVTFTTSAVIGVRNSVLFDKPATTADSINSETLQYNNRQVDIDHFNSYTSELRVLQHYRLFRRTNSLSAGIQYMNNKLHRQQLGKGTTGGDYDLSLVTPGFGRDMYFKTSNIAFFAENSWALTSKLSVNTGVRVESGTTHMTGTISYYEPADVPNTIKHHFPLFGVSTEYRLTNEMSLYAGWSQAYRPVIFKDIIPSSIYEVSDKNLKDAKGYNIEGGFRGKWHILTWDLSYFRLLYKNRLGTIAQTKTNGDEIIYRTNIGNAVNNGIELFTQAEMKLNKYMVLTLFTSTAYMHAVYKDAVIRNGNTNVDVDGNKVESAPAWQSRNGATIKFKRFSLTALHSHTSSTFADALNTVTPNATGSSGLVPSYNIFDFNARAYLTNYLHIRLNLNNAFDKQYFTKRPQFYPGPGIWPSDGRTASITAGVKL